MTWADHIGGIADCSPSCRVTGTLPADGSARHEQALRFELSSQGGSISGSFSFAGLDESGALERPDHLARGQRRKLGHEFTREWLGE